MEVLVAGHSFVRRLAFDMKVRQFELRLPDVKVSFEGKGGATIGGPKPMDVEIERKLREGNFKILHLELGSNDLDLKRHPHKDIQKLAEFYIRKARVQTLSDLDVVLGLPIPRHEEKFPGSYERTKSFNEILTSLAKSESRIHVWSHKTIFRSDDKFLAKDGIHLNSQGTLRYFHSLRASIRVHIKKIHNKPTNKVDV